MAASERTCCIAYCADLVGSVSATMDAARAYSPAAAAVRAAAAACDFDAPMPPKPPAYPPPANADSVPTNAFDESDASPAALLSGAGVAGTEGVYESPPVSGAAGAAAAFAASTPSESAMAHQSSEPVTTGAGDDPLEGDADDPPEYDAAAAELDAADAACDAVAPAPE